MSERNRLQRRDYLGDALEPLPALYSGLLPALPALYSGLLSALPALYSGLLPALLALYSGLLPALPAQNFQVSASIVPGCLIQGGGVLGTLDFGTVTGIDTRATGATLVQNAAFSIACTPGMTLTMNLGGGNHLTTTRNLQRLNNTDLIAYRLFTNASLTPASEIPVNQAIPIDYGDGGPIQLPVYGQVRLDGFNPAGTYTDTLTVTLSW